MDADDALRRRLSEAEARIEELTRALTDRSMELNDRLEGRMETLEADARAALSRAEVAEAKLRILEVDAAKVVAGGRYVVQDEGVKARLVAMQSARDAAEAALEEAREALREARSDLAHEAGMFDAAARIDRILSTPSPSRGKAILEVVEKARGVRELLEADAHGECSIGACTVCEFNAALRDLDGQDGGRR